LILAVAFSDVNPLQLGEAFPDHLVHLKLVTAIPAHNAPRTVIKAEVQRMPASASVLAIKFLFT